MFLSPFPPMNHGYRIVFATRPIMRGPSVFPIGVGQGSLVVILPANVGPRPGHSSSVHLSYDVGKLPGLGTHRSNIVVADNVGQFHHKPKQYSWNHLKLFKYQWYILGSYYSNLTLKKIIIKNENKPWRYHTIIFFIVLKDTIYDRYEKFTDRKFSCLGNLRSSELFKQYLDYYQDV